MIETIRIGFAGDGRLVQHLTPMSARALLSRLVEVNGLTRHELSLFELGTADGPALHRLDPLPGDPADPEIAAQLPLLQRLRYNRSLAPKPRASHPRAASRTTRWPALAHIAEAELRRIEGLVSARVLDGTWRLSHGEARLGRSELPGWGRRAVERVRYLPLFGAIFVVEPLRTAALHASPGRDVIVERVDRSFQLVRFDGVATAREGGLVLRLRDRMRLDRAWAEPLGDRSERAALRWYEVRAALPQEGFAFVEAPSLGTPVPIASTVAALRRARG
ncbi:MAG: hypothetical protein QM820_10430 [Minicystis sp.]